jgi:hypothetical protein
MVCVKGERNNLSGAKEFAGGIKKTLLKISWEVVEQTWGAARKVDTPTLRKHQDILHLCFQYGGHGALEMWLAWTEMSCMFKNEPNFEDLI